MFVLRHVPTATYYALSCDARSGLYHRLVCFEKHHDASQVANSLATYKHLHARFPKPSNHVYVLPSERISRQAVQEDVYIDHKDVDSDFLREITANHLAVLLVSGVSDANVLAYHSFEPSDAVDVDGWNRRLR
jgi:hypothetical protein